MLHPEMDKDKTITHLVEFRKSMKKFTAEKNTTFSVVDYSKPYSFGRLNNDIIVLLSSLGISNDALLAKQQNYFDWISASSSDTLKACDFLAAMNEYDLAQKVLFRGIEDLEMSREVSKLQRKEISSFKNERTNKGRTRMIIEKSRLLFGVCDPFRVLKEGQVHIRISGPKGHTTPIHADVLVVRNPCLHPGSSHHSFKLFAITIYPIGDCLKLRAVRHERLDHLTDCIVFASVARPGHHAAPSMTSGGDLDGMYTCAVFRYALF
jgi:hypothetical protein